MTKQAPQVGVPILGRPVKLGDDSELCVPTLARVIRLRNGAGFPTCFNSRNVMQGIDPGIKASKP